MTPLDPPPPARTLEALVAQLRAEAEALRAEQRAPKARVRDALRAGVKAGTLEEVLDRLGAVEDWWEKR